MELATFTEQALEFAGMGSAVTDQARDIFEAWQTSPEDDRSDIDAALEECNINAVEMIFDWLKNVERVLGDDLDEIDKLIEYIQSYLGAGEPRWPRS